VFQREILNGDNCKMTISLRRLPRLAARGRLEGVMMIILLLAGIVVLAAGLLAIVAGIPVKEFSLGNTLILAGAVTASAGVILLGLSVVVRELQNIVRLAGPRPRAAPDLSTSAGGQPASPDRGEPPAQPSPAFSPAVPGQEDAASRDRAQQGSPSGQAPAEPAPAKPRRNLLFSSSRKERATARGADQPEPEPTVAPQPVAPPAAPAPKPAAATFDDAWPQSDRPRPDAGLRRARTLPTSEEPAVNAPTPQRPAPSAPAEEPAARSEEPPPVTVLKSGVVDGMAYSLYSDGSIEAQMPEGMMRFASIDELRSHLDHRP
jgi:hypothetical protein